MPHRDAPHHESGQMLQSGLFWTGVALAPLAALLLLVADGSTTLRIAAVLTLSSVVLIGLATALRREMGTGVEVGDDLRDEIEQLRRELYDEIAASSRASRQVIGEQMHRIAGSIEALRARLDAEPSGAGSARVTTAAPVSAGPAAADPPRSRRYRADFPASPPASTSRSSSPPASPSHSPSPSGSSSPLSSPPLSSPPFSTSPSSAPPSMSDQEYWSAPSYAGWVADPLGPDPTDSLGPSRVERSRRRSAPAGGDDSGLAGPGQPRFRSQGSDGGDPSSGQRWAVGPAVTPPLTGEGRAGTAWSSPGPGHAGAGGGWSPAQTPEDQWSGRPPTGGWPSEPAGPHRRRPREDEPRYGPAIGDDLPRAGGQWR